MASSLNGLEVVKLLEETNYKNDEINLLDLQRQSKIIKSLISKISMTIDNCDFISGDAKELEATLQNFTNSENVITCGNGTDALQISLMGILSQPNSYVICPSLLLSLLLKLSHLQMQFHTLLMLSKIL